MARWSVVTLSPGRIGINSVEGWRVACTHRSTEFTLSESEVLTMTKQTFS